jgi:capsular exopolysaccharide synthesis family protein
MFNELIVKEDPKSPISEIFRTLRTNIQFTNTKNKLQSLLVTSTIAGEGKSWISANLAVTFAQAGKKVIILDADMRKGRQYKIFDISPRPGLSNYLSGVTENDKEVDLADYVQETEIENLFVIPAGNVPPNPSELLVSESMLHLLEKLKEICDIVIIDGPPTQLVTDSLILARIADSTVIIAEGNKTKKENLRRIVANIQKVGGKIAGVVLNKMKLSSKKYDKSYYYYGSTGMVVDEKNKKSKRNKKNSEIIYIETRNRNTERARQLVNQNKIKEEQNNINKNTEDIKQPNINTENIKQSNINTEIMGIPEFLKNNNINKQTENIQENNSEIKNKYELDDKTKEILKQINEYLENEKKNLKQ